MRFFEFKLMKLKLKISSSVTLATFQVLKSNVWLVAIVLNSAGCFYP